MVATDVIIAEEDCSESCLRLSGLSREWVMIERNTDKGFRWRWYYLDNNFYDKLLVGRSFGGPLSWSCTSAFIIIIYFYMSDPRWTLEPRIPIWCCIRPSSCPTHLAGRKTVEKRQGWKEKGEKQQKGDTLGKAFVLNNLLAWVCVCVCVCSFYPFGEQWINLKCFRNRSSSH